MEFNNPISYTPNPISRCSDEICTPIATPCDYVCGYDVSDYSNCSGCLDGDCVNCYDFFKDFSVEFLGGYVAGFNSRLGFGASESSVNIDLVIEKYSCPEVTTNSPNGACCLPDGSCSTGYADETDCENAGGTWYPNASCDDDPCGCAASCNDGTYVGAIGYIYTFNFGGMCFRGILSNHTYTEDSSGYRYRVTLTDGRKLLNNITVILNNIYNRIPLELNSNVINVLYNREPSVGNNTCGNGEHCNDFMDSGADFRGIRLLDALVGINNYCISVPISNAGLILDVSRLITLISPELRTTNSEMRLLEFITLCCEESGYDFITQITNDNKLEIIPVNYRIEPKPAALLNFIQDLSRSDIVISKEYGEESTDNINKRIVFGTNIHYLTSVLDFPAQQYTNPVSAIQDVIADVISGQYVSSCFIKNSPAVPVPYTSIKVNRSGGTC